MLARLKDGFEIEINEKTTNDWRFLSTLRKIDKGESGLIVDVAEMLFGDEGVEKLAKHLEVDGVTPVDSMVSAITELMESVGEVKLITLASMMNISEDALICDLAETYHIYDMRSLPLRTVATLSAGLREDSRIVLLASDVPARQEVILRNDSG